MKGARVDVLEAERRPVLPKQTQGVVYALEVDAARHDMIKFGKSRAFKRRLQSHNSSHIDGVKGPLRVRDRCDGPGGVVCKAGAEKCGVPGARQG
jgi:hypothetical protein